MTHEEMCAYVAHQCDHRGIDQCAAYLGITTREVRDIYDEVHSIPVSRFPKPKPDGLKDASLLYGVPHRKKLYRPRFKPGVSIEELVYGCIGTEWITRKEVCDMLPGPNVSTIKNSLSMLASKGRIESAMGADGRSKKYRRWG